MSKNFVTETYLDGSRQNFYYLLLPEVSEDGFYRAVSSYNAFFNSCRNPKANVTEVRQFTSDDEKGIEIRKEYLKTVDWDGLRTFASIWDFYSFVGYDYKRRRYESGERQKRFDGRKFV